jgi:hypothetical protein
MRLPVCVPVVVFAVSSWLSVALARPAHAAPPERRCAALTNAPHVLQAAGRATAGDEARAIAAARQQASAEVARSLCASITSVDRDRQAERDGQGQLEASSSVEVRSQMEGLEGLEVKETAAWKNADGSVEACVVLEISRLALDERRRRDVEVLTRAEQAVDAAAERCGPAARAALDAVPPTLRGLCPGLRTARGASVPALLARVAAARDGLSRAETQAASRRAVGLVCTDAAGAALACPPALAPAATAALSAAGLPVDPAPLSDTAARALVSGQGADALCGRGALVLHVEVTGQSAEKRKKATEHFARVRARWLRLSPAPGGVPERREGAAAEQNGGGYSAEEALTAAAKAAVGALVVP